MKVTKEQEKHTTKQKLIDKLIDADKFSGCQRIKGKEEW